MRSSKSLTYPDFLIIGAQKAGTTWLHRNLQAHPEIWMPKEKELHYFDEKIKMKSSLLSKIRGDEPPNKRWRRQAVRQLKGYRRSASKKKKLSLKDLQWDFRYLFKRPGNEWYASLFEQGRGRITGEATPDYSTLDRDGVARVHEVMPEAKIVFFMRNPMERDWSAVDMGLRFRGRSLELASPAEIQAAFGRPRVHLFSDYRRTLENWGAFYPPEQMFVGFLEDIHFHPDELLGNVYGFLGVDLSARYRVIKRKIHSGAGSTMGTKAASLLATGYRDELKYLDERFGGYVSFWLYCAKRLIEDPPQEETLPYPLFGSCLWDEWTAGSGGFPGSVPQRVQSGSLASIQAAS